MVHSGSFAAYINPNQCYGRQCNNCCTGNLWQDMAIPSGATLTSYSLSAWYYIPTTNTGTATVSVTGIECAGEPGSSGSTKGSWNQLSYSWSGSCTSPSYLELYISVLDHGGSDDVYVDDAVVSYTYVSSSSGATTSPVTAAASGGTVTCSFPFGYQFPQGAYRRSYSIAFPSGETLQWLLEGSGPSTLPQADYTVSGSNVTIPDSTIGANGNSFTLVTAATGSYSVSQSGSQTGDGWYDSGTSATLTAASSLPFSFVSWSGSPDVASPTQSSTTVQMNSYCSGVGQFNVSQ